MVMLQYDPWQIKFLKTKGDKILCTGRQVGKSVTCGKDAGDYAVNNPKSEPIVMIAPTERQAYALYEKTLNYLIENHPGQLARGKLRPTQTRIILKSGVRIYCLPVGLNGLGIRFLTVGRLYVDEASRIPEAVWDAITPALLTTGGDTILLSTPWGAEGEFYRTWINKDEAYDSFTRFSIDSLTVVKDRQICATWTKYQQEKAIKFLEREKARKSAAVYAQEYMGEFISGLRQFFSEDWIKNVMKLIGWSKAEAWEEEFLGQDIARMGGDDGTFVAVARSKRNKGKVRETFHKTITYERSTVTFKITKELDTERNFKKIFIDTGAGGGGATLFDFMMEDNQLKRKIVSINNASASISKSTNQKRRILKEDLYENTLWLGESGNLELIIDDEMAASLRSVQYEYIDGVIHIYGDNTHLVEGLIRACWCTKDKSLNIYIC